MRKFRSARDLILQRYPDTVEVSGNKLKGAANKGTFGMLCCDIFCIIPMRVLCADISINGKLVHSKKGKDHGFLDKNEEQQEVVFAAIGLFLCLLCPA